MGREEGMLQGNKKKMVGISGWLVYGDSSVSFSTFKFFSKMNEVFFFLKEKCKKDFFNEHSSFSKDAQY